MRAIDKESTSVGQGWQLILVSPFHRYAALAFYCL